MTPRDQALQFYAKAQEVAATDNGMAYRLLCSSVMTDPTFAEGWRLVGDANGKAGALAAAIAAYHRALEISPEDVNALVNLGYTLYHAGQNDAARDYTERALAIDPSNANAWCNLSLIVSVDNRINDSCDYALKAFSLSRTPEIELALGFAYLYARDWANGFKHLEARFPYALKAYALFPYPKWAGEPLNGKSLLLISEQGLGDTMSFMRFAPILLARHPGAMVQLQVQPEMVRLIATMCAPFSQVRVGPISELLPGADFWASLYSVAAALDLTNVEIENAKSPAVPYASLAATVPWKIPGRRLHVGIAWAGSAANGVDRWRSFGLERILDLAAVPGAQLYSLQVGPRSQDLYACAAQTVVKDMTTYIRDMADTAAIVRDLDLVITVESALRHLCALLDVECWVPYPHHGGGDFRCGRSGDHPLWDDKTTLYRQHKDCRWEPVFARIADDLRKRME